MLSPGDIVCNRLTHSMFHLVSGVLKIVFLSFDDGADFQWRKVFNDSVKLEFSQTVLIIRRVYVVFPF